MPDFVSSPVSAARCYPSRVTTTFVNQDPNMNRIPLSILLSLISSASSAQVEYLDATSRWSETGGYFSAPISGSLTYEYFLNGDTLIGGTSYHKVQRTGVDSTFMMIPEPPYSQFAGVNSMDAYMGSIREDVSNSSWYVVFQGQYSEQLLYDFGLLIGDTISGTFGDCSANPVVSAIDQVMVNGLPRNRFHLNNSPKYFVEGVGASSGLFGYLCKFFESGNCLETYYLDQDSLIVDGCTPVSTGIGSNENTKLDIHVFPNPTSERITITVADKTLYSVQLMDAQGKVVLHSSGSGQQTLNVEHLANGPYKLIARSNSFHASTTVLIVH